VKTLGRKTDIEIRKERERKDRRNKPKVIIGRKKEMR
jgi:hypothetical protein